MKKCLAVLLMAALLGSLTPLGAVESDGLYLSDIPKDKISVPNLSFDGYEIKYDVNGYDKPIHIASESYSRGIWMHANQSYSLSRAVFDISDYSYSTFSAYIGIESELGTSGEGSCEFIVLGDCSVLYESGIKRRGEEPEYIQVDISGVNTLTLILTNGGDNYAADHGEWAMAKLSGSYTRTKMYEKGVYLTNLPSSLTTVPNLSWDGYTIFTDKNTSGGTLSVCGEKYHKGIWMHANPQYDLSRAVVDLSGFDFTSFTVDVGIDDDQRCGTCEFELLGDGLRDARQNRGIDVERPARKAYRRYHRRKDAFACSDKRRRRLRLRLGCMGKSGARL